LKFENLAIFFFGSNFGFNFFMKGVLGCLMGVHEDKKIIQSF
jgi:hypothetical protein